MWNYFFLQPLKHESCHPETINLLPHVTVLSTRCGFVIERILIFQKGTNVSQYRLRFVSPYYFTRYSMGPFSKHMLYEQNWMSQVFDKCHIISMSDTMRPRKLLVESNLETKGVSKFHLNTNINRIWKLKSAGTYTS